MKKIISLLFVAGVLNTVAAQKITMYSTTASERWTSQKVTVFEACLADSGGICLYG